MLDKELPLDATDHHHQTYVSPSHPACWRETSSWWRWPDSHRGRFAASQLHRQGQPSKNHFQYFTLWGCSCFKKGYLIILCDFKAWYLQKCDIASPTCDIITKKKKNTPFQHFSISLRMFNCVQFFLYQPRFPTQPVALTPVQPLDVNQAGNVQYT